MSHYTVSYHDAEMHQLEICEYADNAYEAIEHSKEDVPYLHEHPSFIDYCRSEVVQNIIRLMESGIPMGR